MAVALQALMIAPGLLIFLWVASSVGRGFDVTDEAYYLYSIQAPSRYPFTTTQFGFVYHPIDILVGGQIRLIRLANLAITFGLAALATCMVLRTFGPRQAAFSARLAVATGVGSVSLALFAALPRTPSYNSLDAQAVLLVATGVVLSRMEGIRDRVAAGLSSGALVGLGGTLLFLAKPPAAVAVGVISALALLLPKPRSWASFVAATATSLVTLLMFAYAVDRSPGQFVRRLSVGLTDGQSLDPRYDVGHVFAFQMLHPSTESWALFVAMVVVIVAATIGLIERTMWPWAPVACVAILVLAAGFINRPGLLLSGTTNQSAALPLLAPIVAAAILTVRSTNRPPAPVAVPLFLLIVPYAGAFGTANGLWLTAALAPTPWILAGVARMSPLTKRHGLRVLAPTVATTLVTTAAMLAVSGAHPYRQSQPIWEAGRETKIGTGGLLELPASLSQTIVQLQSAATKSNFVPGTGILDLTGEAPGLAFALGASAPANPWMIGGYPGSESAAIRDLSRTDCSELARSWLLRAPTEERTLPTTVLSSYGAFFPKDFERVARVSARGATPELDGPIELWRPKRAGSQAIDACRQTQGR